MRGPPAAVLRLQCGHRAIHERHGPFAIKARIIERRRGIGELQRRRVFPCLIERLMHRTASALLAQREIVLIAKKILHRAEQVIAKAPERGIGPGESSARENPREKLMRDLLRRVLVMTTTPEESE